MSFNAAGGLSILIDDKDIGIVGPCGSVVLDGVGKFKISSWWWTMSECNRSTLCFGGLRGYNFWRCWRLLIVTRPVPSITCWWYCRTSTTYHGVPISWDGCLPRFVWSPSRVTADCECVHSNDHVPSNAVWQVPYLVKTSTQSMLSLLTSPTAPYSDSYTLSSLNTW